MKTKKLLLLFILFTLLAACITLVSCYEEQTDKSAELLQIKGAEISNYSAEIIIDSQTSNVNFGEIVSCSDRYQWKLFYEGYAELSNKIAPITNNGDNHFVIKLYYKGAETKHVYTVNVFRNFLVEIRYYDADYTFMYSEKTMTNAPYSVNTTNIPMKDGYEFVGWADYTDKTITSITPTGYVSLYAKFRPKAYDFALDVNGGEPLANNVIPVTFGQYYKLPVPAREGYDFVCWEDEHGDAYTDENGNSLKAWSYFFNPQLTARWSAKSYNVTVECDATYGSVTGGGSYQYGSQVTVTANAKGTYPWLGWYNGDTLVSEYVQYSFTMPSRDVSLSAKWGAYQFVVNQHDEGEALRVIATQTAVSGQSVSVTRSQREPITTDRSVTLFVWQGWYEAGRLLTTENVYHTVMPNRSVTVTERWTKLTFRVGYPQITLKLSNVNPVLGDEITATATSNEDKKLEWYKDDTVFSETPSISFIVDDKSAKYYCSFASFGLTLTETPSINKISFAVKLDDDDFKYAVDNGQTLYFRSGTRVTVTVQCEDMSNSGATVILWKGWKIDGQLISAEYEYTFEMPEKNVTLEGDMETYSLRYGVNVNAEDGKIDDISLSEFAIPCGLYKYGEQVTLTAPVVDGYKFVSWSVSKNSTNIWLTDSNTLYILLVSQDEMGIYMADYRKIN